MNNKELQALRKLFFLSVAESAEHVGGVSARTWQRWELGEYKVPDDVAEKFNFLFDRRLKMIETVDHLLSEHEESEGADIEYYFTIEEYQSAHPGSSVIDWRLSQSVAAYFLGEGIAKLK